MEIKTVGLDIAKHVFQVHGVDARGNPVIKRRLRRAEVHRFFAELPACVVGIEACGTAHYWARELSAMGHDVKLMPHNMFDHSSNGTRTTPPTRKPFARR